MHELDADKYRRRRNCNGQLDCLWITVVGWTKPEYLSAREWVRSCHVVVTSDSITATIQF
jgi:hypothetical protein